MFDYGEIIGTILFALIFLWALGWCLLALWQDHQPAMKIRKRMKFDLPATVWPGDTLRVTYRQPGQPDRVLVRDDFTRAITFDEAFTFEDVIDGRYAIGGGIIEAEE